MNEEAGGKSWGLMFSQEILAAKSAAQKRQLLQTFVKEARPLNGGMAGSSILRESVGPFRPFGLLDCLRSARCEPGDPLVPGGQAGCRGGTRVICPCRSVSCRFIRICSGGVLQREPGVSGPQPSAERARDGRSPALQRTLWAAVDEG